MRTVVTGFGPFGSVTDNPSGRLARECGTEFRLLEVAYASIDEALDEIGPVDRLLLMGVAASRRFPRLELVARKACGPHPDVRGAVGPLAIDDGPDLLRGRWTTRPAGLRTSRDAGGYLCNYVYRRALLRHPKAEVAFLHVVPFARVGFEEQLALVRSLLASR